MTIVNSKYDTQDKLSLIHIANGVKFPTVMKWHRQIHFPTGSRNYKEMNPQPSNRWQFMLGPPWKQPLTIYLPSKKLLVIYHGWKKLPRVPSAKGWMADKGCPMGRCQRYTLGNNFCRWCNVMTNGLITDGNSYHPSSVMPYLLQVQQYGTCSH